MENTREEEQTYLIWINHTDKILSFKHVEGFEQLQFPSQAEKLEFAIGKSSSGYRIQ